ncbi:MAG: HlyC/CorC family transporter [Ruminococcaceae bacterium]|nr:HlyC/CorC family transporter [Oscillospiraceae bacterium]
MSPILSLVVLLLLTAVNAFFSMSEIAIITLNDTKIKKLAEDGHKAAAKIVRLTKDSSGFLATIQVGVTFAGFLSSAVAASNFAAMLGEVFAKIPGINLSVANSVATVIITLLLSFFNLVFGELVPKKIGMQKAERISFRIVGILLFVGKIFKPFVMLLSATTNLVAKLFGVDPDYHEKTVTEEEILMMVDVGGEKGVIEESERDMIANIFEFDDTTASEIMTHRTEVIAVENTDSLTDIANTAIEEGVSRIPVYEDDLDTILGIVYVKDLLRYVGHHDTSNIKPTDIMRPAFFIPESKRLADLFSEMTEKKIQMAVVVDEYGGTSGIITMEDLLESIVGNIQDEFDNEDEDISKVSDNCFTVDGTTPIDEVTDMIGVELPEGDYDTIAGYIVTELGRIPKNGEHPVITFGSATLTVETVEDQRIAKVMVLVNKEDKTDEQSEK